MNRLGARRKPFVFVIDSNAETAVVMEPFEAEKAGIFVSFDKPILKNKKSPESIITSSKPMPFKDYLSGYNFIQQQMRAGNSYLANFTCRSEITISVSLKEVFHGSDARFKLLYGDRFVVFSPERFVKIRGGIISTFPMKGTIDASETNAEEKILSDEKEFAEHITVVDLLRNDIGSVATDVYVKRFRYVEKISGGKKDLLQVSSEITGNLPEEWESSIGTIMTRLLPAGSVTGAPKKKTVEILKSAEYFPRGFYTGVFGYFDGESLDSAVMIRFIEKHGTKHYYRSGGGITIYSRPHDEYMEMIEKIYVPIY